MKQKISKTLITNISELQPGDVIYVYHKSQAERNAKREDPWPSINFHRITVVSEIDPYQNGNTLGVKSHDTLIAKGNSRDVDVVKKALADRVICEECAHGIMSLNPNHVEVYKLNNVANNVYVFHPRNLVGNPAYDLMH